MERRQHHGQPIRHLFRACRRYRRARLHRKPDRHPHHQPHFREPHLGRPPRWLGLRDRYRRHQHDALHRAHGFHGPGCRRWRHRLCEIRHRHAHAQRHKQYPQPRDICHRGNARSRSGNHPLRIQCHHFRSECLARPRHHLANRGASRSLKRIHPRQRHPHRHGRRLLFQ